MKSPPPPQLRLFHDPGSALGRRALYGAVLLAFVLAVLALVFHEVVTVLLLGLLTVIIALPLSAAATRLERIHVPRPIGVVLALVVAIACIAGLVTVLVPTFSHEINHFVDALPGIVTKLRDDIGHATGNSSRQVGQQVQDFFSNYTKHPAKLLGPAASVGVTAAGIVAALIVVLLTAVYTAINPGPLIDGAVRLVSPMKRLHARHILDRLAAAYLGWLRGLIVGMVILGLVTYGGLSLVGLQYAAAFAVITAVLIVVPYFGALVSMIPPVLFALTISPTKALIVAGIYLVAHQIEGNLIEPLVMARAVKLHPAMVAIGVITVERLFGFFGLVLAVPILVTFKILVEELWVRPMEEPEGLAEVPVLPTKAEVREEEAVIASRGGDDR